MKNFVKKGKALNYTNAGTAIVAGQFLLIGVLGAVALVNIANGETGVCNITGVYSVTKVTTDAVTQGAKLYWDAAASKLTTTVGSNTYVGIAADAAANGATTVNILLNGLPE